MTERWPRRGGEVGARMRAIDWSRSSLGATDRWPPSLRTVVDLMLSSRQPVYLTWGPEHLSLFNDHFIPILGAKYPDALGMPFSELWAEVWQEYRPIVSAVMAGEAQYFLDQPVTLAGSEAPRWFTFAYTPLRDESDQVAGLYCTALEVTDKVRAVNALRANQDAALRASEDRYRTLFNVIDEGFCIIEVLFDGTGRPDDYRFVEANRAFAQHCGLHDAIGKTMRDFAPDMESWWFEVYGRVLQTGEPARFENYAASFDRWFDVFAFRIGDPAECHVAVLFSDISARKRAEAALLEADRRKDVFLATLAHELRNPLAPLRTGMDLARQKVTATDPLRQTIDKMDRQLSHMVRLVDDLLDVSRISSGKVELQRRGLTVREVILSSVESTRDVIEQRGHALELELGAQEHWLDGDLDRLSQVFTNLLSNAAKYTELGGHIRVEAAREGDRVMVRVCDSGIGIPHSELSQVFELFSQVRAHQRHTAGGLGIGLALVKSLVGLHGGTVEAASAGAGKGSCFTVRLPCARPSTPTAEPPKSVPPHSARMRIVVADDNLDAVEMLAELLESFGHEVWMAGDGQEAVDAVSAHHPDVAVLDLGMPRMDGFEAARAIRATAEGKRVKLIALTGWGQASDRQQTREAGFDAHMVKPITPESLMEVLNEQVGKH